MLSIRNLAFAASTIFNLVSAAPSQIVGRQTFVPGTLNNTREFYLRMHVTDGCLEKYNGYLVEAYHTGAGLADPVFVASPNGARAYLNNTNLQFDVYQFPFSADASPGDTNYARWEPVSISAGYGSGGFVNNRSSGIVSNNEEFGGWIVCEWFHGINLPQLFQLIKGFASEPADLPSSCANVHLFPEFI